MKKGKLFFAVFLSLVTYSVACYAQKKQETKIGTMATIKCVVDANGIPGGEGKGTIYGKKVTFADVEIIKNHTQGTVYGLLGADYSFSDYSGYNNSRSYSFHGDLYLAPESGIIQFYKGYFTQYNDRGLQVAHGKPNVLNYNYSKNQFESGGLLVGEKTSISESVSDWGNLKMIKEIAGTDQGVEEYFFDEKTKLFRRKDYGFWLLDGGYSVRVTQTSSGEDCLSDPGVFLYSPDGTTMLKADSGYKTNYDRYHNFYLVNSDGAWLVKVESDGFAISPVKKDGSYADREVNGKDYRGSWMVKKGGARVGCEDEKELRTILVDLFKHFDQYELSVCDGRYYDENNALVAYSENGDYITVADYKKREADKVKAFQANELALMKKIAGSYTMSDETTTGDQKKSYTITLRSDSTLSATIKWWYKKVSFARWTGAKITEVYNITITFSKGCEWGFNHIENKYYIHLDLSNATLTGTQTTNGVKKQLGIFEKLGAGEELVKAINHHYWDPISNGAKLKASGDVPYILTKTGGGAKKPAAKKK